MLKFKKQFTGNYKSENGRYIFLIAYQAISKKWILSIQDKSTADCLTDTMYFSYDEKRYCIEHANNI